MQHPYASHTEQMLFAKIADDDVEAFTELFRRYSRRIQALVFKLTKSKEAAEDVTQEVFIWLWDHRKNLREIDAVQSYLFKMAANRTNNFLRSMLNDERKCLRLGEIMRDRLADSADGQALLHNSEKLLMEAIDQLPQQQQKVYRLRFFDELDYEQIGDRLNISQNTVRNHFVAANRAIRTYLIEKQGFLPGVLVYLLLKP